MDDEELILKACGDMLKQLGCRVSFACDGTEAERLYRAAAGDRAAYDVVILDLTIPGGIGGLETIQRLRSIDPAVKAIISSGYADTPVINSYKDYGFSGVVHKPYRLKELSLALKNALEQ